MTLSGEHLMNRLETLAEFSDSDSNLSRVFLTDAHRGSAEQLMQWMRDAGLAVNMDAIGNIIGRYEGSSPGLPALIIGSHYDTVTDAGKYDGLLGILAGIACIEELHQKSERFPFAIEIVGFSEEEGVRYGATLLGSRAFAGTFDFELLKKEDADGITMADAIRYANLDPDHLISAARQPADILAYVEAHIEQGPVLLGEDLPVGIVTSIAGASRYQLEITGPGGHAGTMPMAKRIDPVIAAAEIVTFIEQRCSQKEGLFGTVGVLKVIDGLTNCIAKLVRLSIDIRAGDDADRSSIIADLMEKIAEIEKRRNVQVAVEKTHEANAAQCSEHLVTQLEDAVQRTGTAAHRLVSGAGHDAMALPELTDIAMLFVRCGNGGVSHHPDEIITASDAEVTVRVLLDFIRQFRANS